jgi:hypothetical protein
MMTNASSPKRRRTDDAQSTPEQIAAQVAASNATLNKFLNNRQNRWATLTREEGVTGTNQEETGRRDHNTGQPPNPQPIRLPTLNLNTLAGHSSTAQQSLVNYESPYTARAPTPMTAVAALQSRTPSATTPHPSLPSPAPSEDNAGSPASAIIIPDEMDLRLLQSDIPAKRPRGRPRKHPVINTNVATTAPVRSPYFGAQMIMNHNSPLQLQANLHAPTIGSNLSPANSRANSIAHAQNAAISPQQNMQHTLPPRPPSGGGLLSVTRMKLRLKDFFEPRAQIINAIDQGRRTLVQEAIEKEDFFYLVLSQVFCLHTCRPELMPKQLERVHPSSWVFLEQLLCSNQALSPLVVQWFSEFPAPVHIIFASGESRFYMNQLVVVESFLQELPRRWDHIVNVTKKRLAPPLTQEMVEELYLISPVVQTTAFRALARSFWRGEDNPGLHYLESLHKTDQHTYTFQQWRRTKPERKMAYGVYTRVFNAWKQQCALQGSEVTNFVPPPGCEYLGQPPPSMAQDPILDMNDNNPQFSRGAAQQMQLMEMNHRILAQRQAVPGLSTEQQQMLLQNNNQTIAQQGLSPNLLQHLQYHPYQPLAPQPGPRYNTMTVLSNGNGSLLHAIAPQMAIYQPANYAAPHLSRLLPPENALPRPLPVQPDTVRVSLHQAHLRSPIPGNQQLVAGEKPLYRYVTGYALPPTPIDNILCAQSITLSMSQADLDNIPGTTPGLLPGEPCVRPLKEGSVLYRLRCSKMPLEKGFDTEASWVTADNTWPEILIFQLNNHYLEARRKLHYGRCLPIDLSFLLQPGTNTLNIYTIPHRLDTNSYVIAIERVSVSSHISILSTITPISATDSLAAIKRSLASPPDEDDDIAMTSSTLAIPLFDPYRADRICDTPIRGSACLHRECFDLETFLSQCKREQPGYPCVPDCWRCPICKGDVRPQTLVEDGFLVQVREDLAGKGLLDTRAIVVEADGSWKPRVEAERSGVRSASLEREEAVAAVNENMNVSVGAGTASGVGGKGKGKVVEVIELD